MTILNPWVALGILFLLGFFAAYMTALSWADLTYVLPATSLGYVLLALIAKFVLHEQVTTTRWLGIGLISAGVGFVTQGPALTHILCRTRCDHAESVPETVRLRGSSYETRLHLGSDSGIVLASTTGDVLLSRAMKHVGDVGELWRSLRLLTVGRPHPEQSQFSAGDLHDGGGVLQFALCLVLGRRQPGRAGFRIPHLRSQRNRRQNLPA